VGHADRQRLPVELDVHHEALEAVVAARGGGQGRSGGPAVAASAAGDAAHLGADGEAVPGVPVRAHHVVVVVGEQPQHLGRVLRRQAAGVGGVARGDPVAELGGEDLDERDHVGADVCEARSDAALDGQQAQAERLLGAVRRHVADVGDHRSHLGDGRGSGRTGDAGRSVGARWRDGRRRSGGQRGRDGRRGEGRWGRDGRWRSGRQRERRDEEQQEQDRRAGRTQRWPPGREPTGGTQRATVEVVTTAPTRSGRGWSRRARSSERSR
jgi:hypothetical protein